MTEEKAKTLEHAAMAALLRLWLSASYDPRGSGVLGRIHTVCVHLRNLLLGLAAGAMQGQHLEVLLICFVPQNQKYCSFKYCALHRMFCHKLLNIYIFFNIQTYVYFHIYRTIKCFCSLI